MDKTEEKIQKMTTLIEQNGALMELSNKLVGMLTPSTEIESGKVLIADAINKKGGNASGGETLSSLATKIKALNVINQNSEFILSMERPLRINHFILNRGGISKANSEYVSSIIPYAFHKCSELLEANFPNCIDIGDYSFSNCSNLQKIYFPNVITLGKNAFSECTKIEEIYLPNASTIDLESFYYCTNLKTLSIPNAVSGNIGRLSSKIIKLVIGKKFTTNISFVSSYRNSFIPTEAMSKTSVSLVEEGETFSSNNEKWNHNIREYFAANLPDRTGMDALTITFDATVLTNMTDETKLAFTNKNWNLA